MHYIFAVNKLKARVYERGRSSQTFKVGSIRTLPLRNKDTHACKETCSYHKDCEIQPERHHQTTPSCIFSCVSQRKKIERHPQSLTTTSADALHNMQHLTELSRQLYTCTQRSKVTLRGCQCLDQKDRWFERGGHVTYDGCRQPPSTHPEIFFQVGWRFHLSPPGHMIKQGFMLQYVHKSTPVKCQFAVFWVVFLRGRRPSGF